MSNGGEVWKRKGRTCDLETFLVVGSDGAVLDGLVEEVDDGEDELLFLICHRRCKVYVLARKQPTTTIVLSDAYDEDMFFCCISGEPPQDPVVSAKSGHVYERRLIVKYISDNGTDPLTGEKLEESDLLPVKASP